MSSYVDQARQAQVARRSIARLKDLVRSGGLASFAEVDVHTGEVNDAEARALFASLPAVTPASTPDELVEIGLISQAARGLSSAYDRPKYRAGRRVFVRTSVSHQSDSPRRPVGSFDPEGKVAFTHRAVLRAQRGDDFLVDLEGAPSLLPFARTDIFSWNEPCGVRSAGGTISGVQIDYNNPRFKAFICAGYIEIADALAELDFGDEEDAVVKAQAGILYRLASMIGMTYAGRTESYGGNRAGSLIAGGGGVCFVQRAVAGAFLQAFARNLAFEVQVAVGRTLRLDLPHGFLVITLRPSTTRYVCDPAWSEPLTELPAAFFGSRWGHDRRLDSFEGEQDLVVRPAEIDLPDATDLD